MPHIMRMERRNALFQEIGALKTNRSKRTATRLTVVEGVHPLEVARNEGVFFEHILYRADKPLSGWARDFIASCGAGSRVELSADLMEELSDRDEGSELIGVAALKTLEPADVPTEGGFWAVLDRPASPGTLGAVIRTLDAFSASALFILGHAADPFDPQTIRASIGTVFSLPICPLEGPDALTRWVDGTRGAGVPVRIVGTSAKADVPLEDADLSAPTLLLFGNEKWGLSKALKSLADQVVTIPMSGSASSLNLACAATVCAWEVSRQRRGRANVQTHV